MGQDKAQLNKLFQFISKISEDPENDWFKKKLQEKYSVQLPKIDELYELCVFKVLKEQADNFYRDFPLKLKPNSFDRSLSDLFVRMEQEKRKNRIDSFCLYAYQQVESIVNMVWNDTDFKKALDELKDKKYFVKETYIKDKKNPTKVIQINRCRIKQNVASKCLYGKIEVRGGAMYRKDSEKGTEYLVNLDSLDAMTKLKFVLYIVCFNGQLNYNNEEIYKEIEQSFYDLYAFRNNGAHGIAINKTENQQERLNKVSQNASVYYLKFGWLLLKFVELFIQNYDNLASGTVGTFIEEETLEEKGKS